MINLYILIGGAMGLLGYFLCDGIATRHRLSVHQLEWEDIKQRIPENRQLDEYINYCEELSKRHSTAAYFPRM